VKNILTKVTSKKHKVKGFTLIEMVVVVAIIVMLLIIIAPNLTKQKIVQMKGLMMLLKQPCKLKLHFMRMIKTVMVKKLTFKICLMMAT